MLSGTGLRARLAGRLPVYYGWVIFALANLPSFGARPVASVAVLSVFVIPMTEQFGWSRGLFSGAVSLGAVCGLLMSPFAGRLIDRYGSGLILAGCSAIVGTCAIGLAAVSQAWSFYAIYVPGRAVFSSPLELGTTTAISNWFVRRRPMALAWFGAVQGVGLGLLPLAAAMLIDSFGWQSAWLALGIFTIATGVLPPLLLMARRPEDMGLALDPEDGRDLDAKAQGRKDARRTGDALDPEDGRDLDAKTQRRKDARRTGDALDPEDGRDLDAKTQRRKDARRTGDALDPEDGRDLPRTQGGPGTPSTRRTGGILTQRRKDARTQGGPGTPSTRRMGGILTQRRKDARRKEDRGRPRPGGWAGS